MTEASSVANPPLDVLLPGGGAGVAYGWGVVAVVRWREKEEVAGTAGP